MKHKWFSDEQVIGVLKADLPPGIRESVTLR